MPNNILLLKLSKHFEVTVWITALIVLYSMNATDNSSLCLFRFIGFFHCPGCGIGHAIHDALHLQLKNSFTHHPLGIPAVIIIFIRIKQLLFTPKPNE